MGYLCQEALISFWSYLVIYCWRDLVGICEKATWLLGAPSTALDEVKEHSCILNDFSSSPQKGMLCPGVTAISV